LPSEVAGWRGERGEVAVPHGLRRHKAQRLDGFGVLDFSLTGPPTVPPN
jgi:hypothetical protein